MQVFTTLKALNHWNVWFQRFIEKYFTKKINENEPAWLMLRIFFTFSAISVTFPDKVFYEAFCTIHCLETSSLLHRRFPKFNEAVMPWVIFSGNFENIYFIRMFEKIFWFFYSILLFYAGYLSSRKIWKEYSRHLISGRFEVITSFNFLIGGSISRLVAFLSDNFKEDFKKSPARNLEWVISWTHQT